MSLSIYPNGVKVVSGMAKPEVQRALLHVDPFSSYFLLSILELSDAKVY